MSLPDLRIAGLALVGLMTFACGPEIGDECSSDAECGTGRICDLNSRDGYCTLGGCEPNSCPENSVCVTFRNTESYCMAICGSGEDCRDGYVCDAVNGDHAFCRVRAACMPEDDPEAFPECSGE